MNAPAERALLLREDRDGVVRLTLARGERFNPLSSAMVAALQRELDALAADRSARVVVLAAQGRGFCAGHDLKEMREHAADKLWQKKLFDDCSRMMVSLTRLPQPVIARVHGVATAAGCQLVSMCDLAVAAEGATFALPGVTIGVFCSTPAVGVARAIGRKRAMELLLTGDPVGARTALEWGLVNRVVPEGELDAEIGRLCARIGSKSRRVTALGKAAFYRQIEQPIEAAYATTGEAMACNLLLEDAAEGIDAFLQKRAPAWSGE